MKTVVWWTALACLVVAPLAGAQQTLAHASSSAPPPGSALPPPGIDDPGAVPLPATGIPPSVAPAARQHSGGGGDSTNVATQTDANGDTIEQYSRGGHVYMVRVTPKHGVTQTYKVNSPNGSLVPDPRTGAVSPVYYDIYKWGKPAKPANAGTVAAPAASSG